MPQPDVGHPVTILGSGIVGICTALSLLERGIAVRMIDRGAPGQETSMGNAGVISPWSIIPQNTPGVWKTIPGMLFGAGRPLSVHPAIWPKMIPWGLRFLRNSSEAKTRKLSDAMSALCGPSIDLYRKHLNGTGHEHLIRDSAYVHAFRDARRASLDDLGYRIRKERGATLELVGADELRRIEPALSHDFAAAVLIHNQARAVSPGRLGAVLAEKAMRMGAEFVRDEIRSIRSSDAVWTVECAARSYRAEQLVLSLGAWSVDILKSLGANVPLMTERGYHIEYASADFTLNNSIMDVDAKVVASSMEYGLRVAGQAEFAANDTPPNPKRRLILRLIAQSMFADLPAQETRFWMGRRPSFPDSLPMIGEMPGQPGLHLNFGHSHYGLMMAPKSGEVTASMIANAPLNEDMTPFRVGRFSE